MIIEKLSSTAVKISIDNMEMLDYGVSFETLSEDSIETKAMITALLKDINYNTGIDLMTSKLFIEAFSIDETRSCIIYISAINDNDNDISEPYLYYVFNFENIENCTAFINHMSDETRKAILKSSLYLCGDILLMSMEFLSEYEENIIFSAMEFGGISGCGELYCVYADEHYECILKCNAAENLVSILP